MRIIDAIRISVRMLRTNLLRSLLTVLGIGVAVAVITVLIAFGYGLQEITIGSILQSKNLLSSDITVPSGSSQPLTDASVKNVSDTTGVIQAVPVTLGSGEVTVGGKTAAVSMVATRAGYFAMEDIQIQAGTSFNDTGSKVLLSPQVGQLLGLTSDNVIGSTLSLRLTDQLGAVRSLDSVQVSGIAGDAEIPTVYAPYDLFVSEGPLQITSIKALSSDEGGVRQATDILQSQGYSVETLYDSLSQARKIFTWVTIALALFGSIALAVASIGMFNTMTIALLERTKEFGIMKTMGFTDGDIRKLFLVEAGIIGFGGGLFGIALALITQSVIGTVMNQIFVRYGGERLSLFQNPEGLLLAMLVFPMILGLCTGIYPAIRAARLKPLQALRYE